MYVGVEVKDTPSCMHSQCSEPLVAAKHADQGRGLSSSLAGSQAHHHVPG